jgi:hypothetical protein
LFIYVIGIVHLLLEEISIEDFKIDNLWMILLLKSFIIFHTTWGTNVGAGCVDVHACRVGLVHWLGFGLGQFNDLSLVFSIDEVTDNTSNKDDSDN